jgi:hypothetical protein
LLEAAWNLLTPEQALAVVRDSGIEDVKGLDILMGS